MTKPEVCKNPLGGWNVEQFDDDGGCLIAVFTGPRSRERAEEYAIFLTKALPLVRA